MRLPPRPATPPGYVSLELVPRNIKRAVKDAEDVDVPVILDEVRHTARFERDGMMPDISPRVREIS
jgi:hydroxyethylthiazole kinase-like sugar kinase family protein